MKRILLACNAFKESCTSFELNHAIADIIDKGLPGCESTVFPVSDGGDGFLEAVAHHKVLKISFLNSKDISGQKRDIPYIYDSNESAVYFESAAIIGLALIPTGARHPANYDSAPLAEFILLLLEFLDNKQFPVNTICLGIGGTATIDAGLGFYNYFKLNHDKLLKLNKLSSFSSSRNTGLIRNIPGMKLVLDVEVPLLGEHGMLHVFGPQKGLSNEELPIWEQRICNVLMQLDSNREDASNGINKLGAGGGIAVGIEKVFQTECQTGEEFLLKELNLSDAINSHDIIITGEGKLDNSTFSKKAVGSIISQAEANSKSIVLVCGTAEESTISYLKSRNIPIVLLSDGTPGDIDYSIKNPILKLKRSSSALIGHLK